MASMSRQQVWDWIRARACGYLNIYGNGSRGPSISTSLNATTTMNMNMNGGRPARFLSESMATRYYIQTQYRGIYQGQHNGPHTRMPSRMKNGDEMVVAASARYIHTTGYRTQKDSMSGSSMNMTMAKQSIPMMQSAQVQQEAETDMAPEDAVKDEESGNSTSDQDEMDQLNITAHMEISSIPSSSPLMSSNASQAAATTISSQAPNPSLSAGAQTPSVSLASSEPIVEENPVELFNSVWNKLEKEYERMSMPSEIIWLNGAPGSGKSTNTPFILSARGLDAKPIIMSNLLNTSEYKKKMDRGEMIANTDVLELLLRALLDNQNNRKGVLVDGYPRTPIQVETISLLHSKMKELRASCDANEMHLFPKPRFLIVILYVSEKESIQRQLQRGAAALRHNERLREINIGHAKPLDPRATDQDVELCRKRYLIFKEHRDTLLRLQDRFPCKLIDAERDLESVQSAILGEFKYQSAQELRPETYDVIQRIPLAERIPGNARPELVERLDIYQLERPDLFQKAIGIVLRLFIPKIKRNAFAGAVLIRVRDETVRFDDRMVSMILDILSERGYHCRYDKKVTLLPVEVDRNTFRIIHEERTEHMFYVRYPEASLTRALTFK
mmetsp:Transcript_16367/g.28623  ORF Transcript_16367/g.28623 Transcript_16367/m.28623 type:complete len:615 (+) Transcript_16367:480-2324(+)|eukprot:CAMPEP_0184693430 /NCGR_PEP_ID=MMETSP0313-20130426/1658_1 /TAXON_ID=2792 /ORGANISM="Porphyridium aerugineum, Strain SAG 1380-2" /LENGTH=614 /DNA_ID=CAMNT_0027151513 /DNA_START=222 /DNA_END=2066 /DNA_ORIENTATION=+